MSIDKEYIDRSLRQLWEEVLGRRLPTQQAVLLALAGFTVVPQPLRQTRLIPEIAAILLDVLASQRLPSGAYLKVANQLLPALYGDGTCSPISPGNFRIILYRLRRSLRQRLATMVTMAADES